ncbi:MAG: phosphate acyltransferase PlsX [Clostridia bacterium]|nr:phosphate acyltransferase PlsX [Clostridia bacterium]
MRIIVDCMGGDRAPLEPVKGAYAASLEYNASFILVGDRAAIEKIGESEGLNLSRFDIIDAPETVEMTDDPLTVIRQKKDSSMNKALSMLAAGEGDAVVSTGNTGALYTGATLIVRKIKGIKRPAIGTMLPMDPPVLLLDSGANTVCNEEYLEQFAVMGSIYMSKLYGIKNPRVGLLNNGSEECKGTELQLKTFALLKNLPGINFVGNVEADKIPRNACDVLVTDGFTGNILLKSIEGIGKYALSVMKKMFMSDIFTKLSAVLVRNKLSGIKKKFDPSELGGAPILGISKPVIKAHGASDAKAVKNAIGQAINYASSGAIVSIAKEIKVFTPAQNTENNSQNNSSK